MRVHAGCGGDKVPAATEPDTDVTHMHTHEPLPVVAEVYQCRIC